MEYIVGTALHDQNTYVAGEVGSNMFGAIANNYFGWERFLEQTKDLNLDTIRFPGGAVSEDGWVHNGQIRLDGDLIDLNALEGDRSHIAFDLTHPELISQIALDYDDSSRGEHNHAASFSDVIAAAVERGSDVGLIIPVARYYRDLENENGKDFSDQATLERATSIAKHDMSTFLSRLKSGHFNNGVYPEKFIIEIGNEQYKNPIQYGVIAKAMIDIIEEEMSESSIEYEVAVQALRGVADYRELYGDEYFENYLSDDSALISVLAPLVDDLLDEDTSREHRLPMMNKTFITVLGDALDHVDLVRQHTLGFNYDVYGRQYHNYTEQAAVRDIWTSELADRYGTSHGVDFYASAWSANSGNGDKLPFELAAASNILELFSQFSQIGIDRAAIWGFLGEYRASTESTPTTITDFATGIVSPQFAILQLMSDNIRGANLLSSGLDQKLDINVTNANRWWLIEQGISLDGKHENYLMHAYETDDEYHVFLSSGQVGIGGATIVVPLGDAQVASFYGVTNVGIVGGNISGEADVSRSIGSIYNQTAVATFDQSFEIALISLQRSNSLPANQDDLLSFLTQVSFQDAQTIDDQVLDEYVDDFVFRIGDDTSDDLTSSTSKRDIFDLFSQLECFDMIGARSGEMLFGLGGQDSLTGKGGNDWLAGGSGDDTLYGSGGWDHFAFSKGNDVIGDFQFGVDQIIIDRSLLVGGAVELQEIVGFTDSSSIIVFDESNSLEILGNWTLNDIMESITFA